MLHYRLTVLLTTQCTCFQVHNQIAFRLFFVIISRTPDQKFWLISWLIMFANTPSKSSPVSCKCCCLENLTSPVILLGETSHYSWFPFAGQSPRKRTKMMESLLNSKAIDSESQSAQSVELCAGRCLQQHALVPKVHFLALESVFFTSVLILFQVTETRTGPLGCSSYDNLDSVSSILLQSPESKLHLQGKQTKHFIHMY